jgi:hypothetical protein
MSSVRTGTTTTPDEVDHHAHDPSIKAKVAVAWTFVGIPLAYGVYETVKKASALFA